MPIGPVEGNGDSMTYEPQHAPDPTDGMEGGNHELAVGIVGARPGHEAWTIFKMRYLDDMVLHAIGSVVRMSRDKVGKILAQALQDTAEVLEEQGLDAHALL